MANTIVRFTASMLKQHLFPGAQLFWSIPINEELGDEIASNGANHSSPQSHLSFLADSIWARGTLCHIEAKQKTHGCFHSSLSTAGFFETNGGGKNPKLIQTKHVYLTAQLAMNMVLMARYIPARTAVLCYIAKFEITR